MTYDSPLDDGDSEDDEQHDGVIGDNIPEEYVTVGGSDEETEPIGYIQQASSTMIETADEFDKADPSEITVGSPDMTIEINGEIEEVGEIESLSFEVEEGEPVEGDDETDDDNHDGPTIDELLDECGVLAVDQRLSHNVAVQRPTRKITLEVIDNPDGHDLIDALQEKLHEQGAYVPGRQPAHLKRDRDQ